MQTFLILLFMLYGALGEVLDGIEAIVEPSIVNAQNTKLRMFGSIKTPLLSGDYFLITIPNQVSVLYSEVTPGVNSLSCQFLEPLDLNIKSCESLSNLQIKIVIEDSLTDYFQFDVI